jgi:hypothetical protein
LGGLVGYTVRFEDVSSEETRYDFVLLLLLLLLLLDCLPESYSIVNASHAFFDHEPISSAQNKVRD